MEEPQQVPIKKPQPVHVKPQPMPQPQPVPQPAPAPVLVEVTTHQPQPSMPCPPQMPVMQPCMPCPPMALPPRPKDQYRYYEPFIGPFDPCPPMRVRRYVIPPNQYITFQPMNLPQFTPAEALCRGTLWPDLFSSYTPR